MSKSKRKTRTKIKAAGKSPARAARQAERRAVHERLAYAARHDDRMEGGDEG